MKILILGLFLLAGCNEETVYSSRSNNTDSGSTSPPVSVQVNVDGDNIDNSSNSSSDSNSDSTSGSSSDNSNSNQNQNVNENEIESYIRNVTKMSNSLDFCSNNQEECFDFFVNIKNKLNGGDPSFITPEHQWNITSLRFKNPDGSWGEYVDLKGDKGEDGIDGQDGADGKDGKDGKDGVNGINGINGKDGVDGQDGADGKDGSDGSNGQDGVDGINGVDGQDGVDGINGVDGQDGENGKDGIDGKDGADGKDGVDGINGTNGKDGVDGKDGADGKSCSVEELPDETIRIFCDDGSEVLVKKGSKGDKGEDGIDGQDGEKGEKGDKGDSCSVVRVDNKTSKLSCEDGSEIIVKDGEDGQDGANGQDGLNGSNGSDGSDGEDGKDSDPCVLVDITSDSAKLVCPNGSEFVVKNGKDGVDGQDGEKGEKGDKGDAAECESCCKSCEAYKAKNHAVWFPSYTNLGKYVFVTKGQVQYFKNKMIVSGLVKSTTDSEKMFMLHAVFKNHIKSVVDGGYVPQGSPKDAPSGVNTNTWEYYEDLEATLIGQGKYTGAVLKLRRMGPAIQVGDGGGVHSTQFGAATWFYYDVISQPLFHSYQGTTIYEGNDYSHRKGDININIDCE